MSSVNAVHSFPPNGGYTFFESRIHHTLDLIEAAHGVVADDQIQDVQAAINSGLIWRSELLARVALRLIVADRCRRQVRSYCPNPGPLRAKSKARLLILLRGRVA